MGDKQWKQFERNSAALFGGKRFPANMGHRLDFLSPQFAGQCKEVKSLSLEALTQLVEELDELAPKEDPPRLGAVCVKVRRGTGRPSPALVVLSATTWQAVQALLVQGAEDRHRLEGLEK